MTRARATALSFFAGLGFFYCVARILQVVFALQLEDPPPRAWATHEMTRWGSGAAALLLVMCWAFYAIWKRWDE